MLFRSPLIFRRKLHIISVQLCQIEIPAFWCRKHMSFKFYFLSLIHIFRFQNFSLEFSRLSLFNYQGSSFSFMPFAVRVGFVILAQMCIRDRLMKVPLLLIWNQTFHIFQCTGDLCLAMSFQNWNTVSYTHLDVYKRQVHIPLHTVPAYVRTVFRRPEQLHRMFLHPVFPA